MSLIEKSLRLLRRSVQRNAETESQLPLVATFGLEMNILDLKRRRSEVGRREPTVLMRRAQSLQESEEHLVAGAGSSAILF
jgi:hypothetical protein